MLKEYEYAFNFKNFITEIKENKEYPSQKEIEFNDDKINDYLTRSNDEFNKLMIKIYTRCIVFNNITNEKRAGFVIWSQRVFLLGLFTFPVFILVLVFSNNISQFYNSIQV